ITFKVGQTSKYSYNDAELINRIDVIDIACEEYVQEVLGFLEIPKSGNSTIISDPIVALSSSSVTPFEGGDILLIEKLLNDDPSSPLPPKELNLEVLKTVISSIDDPPELELKDLPSHLEYAFLEGTDKLPIIIAKNLKEDEKMDFPDTFRYLLTRKTKRRPPSLALMAHLPIPFGLCNAPGTFQRCMMAIFHDMIEEMMEVFMDDFSVFEDSFSSCLTHLDKMLKWCEDTNLVLNWEKCHFMVKEGTVLDHKISKSKIEVDKAKVNVIAKLPHPTTVRGIRSFLGHAGFYCRFNQDFSKIA
nr:reverse transcriptase domain-containing protein [Tanacetum cinerariifolium]